MPESEAQRVRVDKWLWHARFFKTRTLAAAQVSGGHVRVNGVKISKPSYAVRAGDTLTFPQARHIRVIRIVGVAERRGPAPEAQALYVDLTPPSDPRAETRSGGPRPTGRERRQIDRFRGDPLE